MLERVSDSCNVMPNTLRAPEVTLGCQWGQPIDIWALGAITLELVTDELGMFLDVRTATPDMTVDELRLARIEELCGPFPVPFLEDAPNRGMYFDSKGTLLKPLPATATRHGNLHDRLVRCCPDLPDKDVRETEMFLRRCLMLDPAARPSISDLVDDEWYSAYD